MNLNDTILEWRQQMVEKLLLQGTKIKDVEESIKIGELLVFGDCVANLKIECSVKHVSKLISTLNEFSIKNGCTVDIVECD